MFFFCKHTATTEIYTLSLHDALPILEHTEQGPEQEFAPALDLEGAEHFGNTGDDHHHAGVAEVFSAFQIKRDRKSTRLNSSHEWISYAVFCLKKKNNQNNNRNTTQY